MSLFRNKTVGYHSSIAMNWFMSSPMKVRKKAKIRYAANVPSLRGKSGKSLENVMFTPPITFHYVRIRINTCTGFSDG